MFYPFKNIFAQEPFSHSSTGSYNGWLYHPYKVTVGGYIEPRHTLLVYSDKMVSLGGGQIGPHPSKNNGGSKSFDLNNKGGIEGLTIKQNVGLNSLQVANATTGHTETDGILLGNKGNIGFINQQENANLEFYTNNQRRATITNQGRVLIGEATPQAQLNIKTITNGINLVSQGSSMNYGLRIGIQTSKNAILVNNKFTVKGDGKVGIGTTNPQKELDVNGTAVVSNYIGINTSNPTQRLDVYGNYAKIKVGNQTEFIKIGRDGANNYIDSYDADGFLAINWLSQNNTVFRGKIGINTLNPQFLLDVRGTAHFCKAIAETNGWCDYVFNDNYKLPKLAEVENYIKLNKHLPEIPTTAEIEKNGIDLGEMDAKLLKKIEELTLYIIEQDKRIKEQDARLIKLEKQ